jgi:biopolymer transport protein ExbB
MRAVAKIGLTLLLVFAPPAAWAQGEPAAADAPVADSEAPGAAVQAEAAAEQAQAPAEAPAAKAPPVRDVPKAKSLDELLRMVRKGWSEEKRENQAREERFGNAKAEQARLLAQARADLQREEQRAETLEIAFEQNELRLAEAEETLAERLGTLGELFGVVRQVAGDLGGHVENSLVSAQIPDRGGFLSQLASSRNLPSIDSLRNLWFELQREMTEQGKVVRFTAPVLGTDGQENQREVIRAGVFSAVSEGHYVSWESAVGKLRDLSRQPPARYTGTVQGFEQTTSGLGPLAIDPSRGSLLSLLIDTPSSTERVQQGGPVGYVIICLGAFAVLLGLARWVMVSITNRKVTAQRKREQADPGNPLGRVLGVYEKNRSADPETLELKLDEAVLRESSRLSRFLWVIRVVSVVAPLLGLLGTVTGMIQTFQAITLFGAGDPRMMAGGISEALVTTMLGLVVAIPLVLLHAVVASSTQRIVAVLDEQSTGLIAARAEQANA